MYIQKLVANIYIRYLAATVYLQTGYLHNSQISGPATIIETYIYTCNTDLIIYIDDRDEIYKAVCATSC